MQVLIAKCFFVLMLIIETAQGYEQGHTRCQYTTHGVKCVDKGLNTIPNGIPRNVRHIVLVNNPSLQIREDYFLQFKHLFILTISNCGQKGPILLPDSLRKVNLESNNFTVDALRQMLANLTSIDHLSLANNSLQPADIRQIFQFLPTTIKIIDLSYNTIKQLTRNELKRLTKLKKLEIKSVSLKNIEPNTFNDLSLLSSILLQNNNISHLPDHIFRWNTRLRYLHLNGNKLTAFNAIQLGLKNVQELFLGRNKLRTFDVRNLKLKKIWLNNNSIQRIDNSIFNNNSVVGTIALSSNYIQSVSINAFNTVTSLSQLLLQNNSLKSLPRNLFKGMAISKIFLQENDLFDLNGAFDGIKPFLNSLDLSRNKNLQLLNGMDFESLPNTSRFYLTCKYVKQIRGLSRMKAKIQCSPIPQVTIATTFTNYFRCKGFMCRLSSQRLIYKCGACTAGYYSYCQDPLINESTCVKCPAGSYYQDEPASNKCKICKPGQFVPPEHSPGRDASDCQACPQGTNTNIVAGTRACKCIHGHSRRYRFGPCEKCKDDGFDCDHDYPTLKRGFWITWQGTTIKSAINDADGEKNIDRKQGICEHIYKKFTENLKVKDDTYDRTTMHFNCQMPLPIKCPMFGSCLGGIQPRCSPKYTGVLCAVCKRGYSLQFNQCIRCPQSMRAALQFIVCIAIFAMLCFVVSITDKFKLQCGHNSTKPTQCCQCRTFADVILSSLKILIGYYQVLVSTMYAFANIRWPNNLKIAINLLEYIQFTIIKVPILRCINPNWKIDAIGEFWIVFIGIIIFLVLVMIYYFFKSLSISKQDLTPSDAKAKRFVWNKNCKKVVALFLFVAYPIISTKVAQTLPLGCHSFCTAEENGSCLHSLSYLRSDYSIPCLTIDSHKLTLITAYICLIFPLGLPILLFVLLRIYAPRRQSSIQQPKIHILEHDHGYSDENNKKNLLPIIKNDAAAQVFHGSSASTFALALKFSYENYHTRYWYWEVIEMIRKLIMTTGVVLFLQHTKIGLSCTIIVSMLFAVLHAIVRPLKSNFENVTQLLSLTLVPLNLAIGAVLQSQDKQNPNIINKEVDSFSLGILLVAMNSILISLMSARILIIIANKIQAKIKKSKWYALTFG